MIGICLRLRKRRECAGKQQRQSEAIRHIENNEFAKQKRCFFECVSANSLD